MWRRSALLLLPLAALGGPSRPPVLLTGELVASRSNMLRVPETPEWLVQVRWMEQDGAAVTKGQKVVELDNSTFVATIDQNRLAALSSQAQLAGTQADVAGREVEKTFEVRKRTVELQKAEIDAALPEELRSKREHQEKQLALVRARSELAKAKEDLTSTVLSGRAEIAVAKVDIEKTLREIQAAESAIQALSLTAPLDGVIVVSDHWREKRKLQSGDMVPVGSPILRIPDPSSFRVEAQLFDVDDGRVAVGAKTRCTFDAHLDREIAGTVTEIAPIAQLTAPDSLRRAFKVVIALDEPTAPWMRPGMSVKVAIGDSGTNAARSPVGLGDKLAPGTPRPPTGRVEEVRVTREDLVLGCEVQGTLQAETSDALGPPSVQNVWEFKIAWMIPEGKAVKKGEAVLRFDTTELGKKLDEARSTAESAGKEIDRLRLDSTLTRLGEELKAAEAEAARKKSALKTDLPAELGKATDVRKAHLDLELAEAEVEMLHKKLETTRTSREAQLRVLTGKESEARRQIERLETANARMTVTAPRDGTVLYLLDWRDEKRKVGDTIWKALSVMEIPDLSRMLVRGEIDESEAGSVAVNASIRFKLDAHQDVEFVGTVRSIGRTIQRRGGKLPIKVVKIEAALDQIDPLRMRPGMRVRGTLERERVKGALVVPRDCVFASPSGPVVFASGGRAIPIQVGKQSGRVVEVRSGLSEGDTVLRFASPPGAARS